MRGEDGVSGDPRSGEQSRSMHTMLAYVLISDDMQAALPPGPGTRLACCVSLSLILTSPSHHLTPPCG